MNARSVTTAARQLVERVALAFPGLFQALQPLGAKLTGRSADAAVRLVLNLAEVFSFLG